MKRFLAGVVIGILGSGLAPYRAVQPRSLSSVPGSGTGLVWAAQHRASEKIVQPQVLVENAKVKIVRWVLKPGEGTPIHTHSLDHVSVIIHGSTLREVEASSGVAKENVQKTGDATFVPAHGQTHSFANAGKTTYESIAIELK
jgi:quercetin dioxygenase-like cupin family protein